MAFVFAVAVLHHQYLAQRAPSQCISKKNENDEAKNEEQKQKKNETHEHNPLKYRIPHGFRACFRVVLQSFNMFRWFLYSLPKRGVFRETTMHANCGKKTEKIVRRSHASSAMEACQERNENENVYR